MPRKRTVPMTFGEGLDRETGVMATRRGTMDDLRNMYHRRGKVVVRKGTVPKLEFADALGNPMTVILAGHMLLGERTGVVVAYQGNAALATYGDVDIYVLDAAATVQRRVGNWFNTQTLGLDPTEPPIVSVTDSYGRAFFAHDELRVTQRAPTFVYDPFQGAELRPLRIIEGWPGYNEFASADAQAEIKFRGVEKWQAYLVGWGFGTSLEDRAELVRVSRPGLPTEFKAEHYFIAGARKDPTIACRPAGEDVLCVFKEVESYKIVGHSRDTFGIFPMDNRYGCVGSRLCVEVEGTVFFWSTHGPRLTNGGASRDISHNLELDAAEPATLAASADLLDGWANYIAQERVVVFAFNRRIYVLSLHDIQHPKWSYWELGYDQFSGFQLYVTGVGTASNTAPSGHAEWTREFSPNQFETDPVEGPRSARVAWDNVGQDGDELVEVWGREANNIVGSPWRMETDQDGDGVVDGFLKETSNTTATFELDGLPQAQVIDVTASSGAGYARVKRVIEGIVAGQDYEFSVEVFKESVAGGAHAELELEWQDGGGTPVGSVETVDLSASTSEHERRFLENRTAPAGAEQVEVRLQVATTAGGDLARIHYRLLEVSPVSSHASWERLGVFQVATTTAQEEVLTDLEPGAYYQTAIRYRRSVFFATGYESSDPTAWPDESRGVAVATAGSEPTLVDAHWRAISDGQGQIEEQFVVEVDMGDRFNLDLHILVDDDSDIGESNPIGVISPPHNATEIINCKIGGGIAPGITRREFELTATYVTAGGSPVGTGSSLSGVWPGPVLAPQDVIAFKSNNGEYTVQWTWGLNSRYLTGPYTNPGSPATRIEHRINGGSWVVAASVTDQSQTEHVEAGLNPSDSVEVRLSHLVIFGGAAYQSPLEPEFGMLAFTV